jgi:hypothetical protein
MLHPYGYHGYRLNYTLPAEKNAYGVGNSTAQYPVLCFCHKYGVCGCDGIKARSVISRPSNSTRNSTDAGFRWNTTYALINGTGYSLLNGTLANGTTAPEGTGNSASSLFPELGWLVWSGGIGLGLLLLG